MVLSYSSNTHHLGTTEDEFRLAVMTALLI